MQQLRERAGKIVQRLSVEEASASDGLETIKATMERSPVIKLLESEERGPTPTEVYEIVQIAE
jgi:Fe2+ or Zn2+ uptake regulation protein